MCPHTTPAISRSPRQRGCRFGRETARSPIRRRVLPSRRFRKLLIDTQDRLRNRVYSFKSITPPLHHSPLCWNILARGPPPAPPPSPRFQTCSPSCSAL